MSQEPERWLDRLVGACFGVFFGALALYGAVWLLRAVWVWVVIGMVVAFVVSAIWFFRVRRNRW